MSIDRLPRAAVLVSIVIGAIIQPGAPSDSQLCGELARREPPASALPEANRRIELGGANAVFLQGCVAYGRQGADKATGFFERAAKMDATRSVYFDWLGRAYGDQAQNANKIRQPFLARKTKAAFETAVALDPNNLDARAFLVDYFQLAPGIMGGSESRASEQIEAIRARNPYRGGLIAANAQTRRKDAAGAERELVKVVTAYPDSISPRYALLAVYVGAKRWPEAFRTVDAARESFPASPVLDYQIARVAALSGQQLDRGEAAVRKYLARTGTAPGEPTFAGTHLRLGQILAHRGQTAAARSELQTALRLDPSLKDAKAALDALPK